MASAKPTAEEEDAFMRDLLSCVDDSFFAAVPTPDPSPVKHRATPIRTAQGPSKAQVTPMRRTAKEAMKRERSCKNIGNIAALHLDVSALVEGAEDWDWGDMNSDFMTPKKSTNERLVVSPKTPASDSTSEPCARCVVESVCEEYVEGRFQKTLALRIDPGKESRRAVLQDSWTETDIHVGDIVNIIGTFNFLAPPSITITTKANLLIHHPDHLLTATSISNALQCKRKPLLSTLIRSSSSDTTPALVWGNMLHEVMQSSLIAGRWEEAWINERVDDVIQKNLGELVKIGIGIEQAKIEMKDRAKGLQTFWKRYMGDTPKSEAILTNTRSVQNQTSHLAISKLHDIEEDIWSPRYGLKGKLDASVQAIIEERNALLKTKGSWTMPFEIKTGRAIAGMEHRAQTMLYTFLMAERYGVEVPSGLLYYTQSEEVIRVPASWNEVRGLIAARNEMAAYMMRRTKAPKFMKPGHGIDADTDEVAFDEDIAEKTEVATEAEAFLPPTINDERVCKKCYSVDACMLYRRAVENVVDNASPIADIYDLKTSHLTDAQCSFFKKWESLISLEEQDIVRFKKELWTMSAKEREAKNRCFADMVIDPTYVPRIPKAQRKEDKIHQHTYKFIKGSTKGLHSLLNGHMGAGDAVTISIEPNLLAFARGFIVELTPEAIHIGVDHAIDSQAIRSRFKLSSSDSGRLVFRIDKDELAGGMGRIRDNLAQLFYAGGDTRRLELVVDLKSPRFDTDESRLQSVQECLPVSLNETQQRAMSKALNAEDYALVLGMPGTGKTTTVAEIIKVLVSRGKTVLLTSYTHSAVDTILLKLKGNVDFEILRLGNVDKVHPDVQEFTLAARRQATSIEQLERQILTPPVVATTCLSLDHALFTRRTFDYCIVDEASQITLPTCLGPLRFANTFVLVGDHFQLPPLVRSRDARKGGFDVSLFRRLSDAHPHAVVDLTYQYRMNEDIMLLSNKLIYGDRLKCGSEEVAKRTLSLPDDTFLRKIHAQGTCGSDPCWLEKVMAETCRVVFLDTDAVPGPDSRVGDLVQNEVEAKLVHQITETLLRGGVRQDQIGVISLYRQQIKLLSHTLQERKDIEILTADRSQGRDKDCIIISMVRSNDAGQIGDLLKDWRRMNVSLTRARSKLIIIGSRTTLQSVSLLSEFFLLMEDKRWILRLPADAHMLHARDFEGVIPTAKRSAEDIDIKSPSKENAISRPQKKAKKGKMEEGFFRARPVLRDLMNDGT